MVIRLFSLFERSLSCDIFHLSSRLVAGQSILITRIAGIVSYLQRQGFESLAYSIRIAVSLKVTIFESLNIKKESDHGLVINFASMAFGSTWFNYPDHLVNHSYKGVYMKADYLTHTALVKKESMMTVTIKGITKVQIENPINQIRTAFTTIPDSFNRKVNEQTGRKVITNIPTQLLGNRIMSVTVEYLQADNRIAVELKDYMPAREVESGVLNKGLSGNVYSDYRTGNLPDDRIGLREFWSVLTYFSGCMLTGMLPTPVKPSGQSTIMSQFINVWLADNALAVDSVAVTGKNDSRMVYTDQDFSNVYNAFQSNANRILNTWADRQGKGGSKSGQINWV